MVRRIHRSIELALQQADSKYLDESGVTALSKENAKRLPRGTAASVANPATNCLLWVIRVYQRTISRLLGPRCRFYPSCSEYAAIALSRHGLLRGSGLAVVRICKCHPLHPGGVDFVPETSREH